jgi:hypothetical protein
MTFLALFKLQPGFGESGNIFPSRPTPSSGSLESTYPASRKGPDFDFEGTSLWNTLLLEVNLVLEAT